MRPGEGLTGAAVAELAPVMIAEKAHLDPRFKHFATVHEEEYESILAVPILAREQAGGRAQRPHAARRASTPGRRSSCSRRSRRRSRSRSSTRSSTPQAQRRVRRAGGARRDLARPSPSRSTSRSRSTRSSRRRCTRSRRRRPRSGSRTGRPRGRAASTARTRCGCRCAGSGRMIGELVCERDTPFVDDDRALLASIAHHAAVARGARTRGDARRRRSGDPPPREEQPPDGRLAPAAAGRLGGHRPAAGARRLGQPDPRDRGGARGADRAAAPTTSSWRRCSSSCAG